MNSMLRYDVGQQNPCYCGSVEKHEFDKDHLLEFNHCHRTVLGNYRIELAAGERWILDASVNGQSNLGAFRNRQLRESAILAAALAAVAVGLHGRGSLVAIAEPERSTEKTERLKRANDRTAAQIMSEVLQATTEALPPGEEVLIASTITEGVRAKPGKEAGGNPTIAVGALFGKSEHRRLYGLRMPPNVTLMSMGNDVIDGTTKSVTNLHSSLTALFITASGVKRHLPDIYVQRWAAGAYFEEFNPRDTKLVEAAEHIAAAYGGISVDKLSAFFLDRPRHYPAMDALNAAGVATPFDKDGDLFPSLVLGPSQVCFPDGRPLNAIIGEIGGSAEWAVGVLPLVWRGGQGIGMLTSHSALTRQNTTAEQRWRQRFHFTEEEFILIQDARFEQKPFFTVRDILEQPFAGGISAFGAITDNIYLPFMKGVERTDDSVRVWTLVINSLGQMEAWSLTFRAKEGLDQTIRSLASPKEPLQKSSPTALERSIGEVLDDEHARWRYRICFNNEYYPALIPINDRLVMLRGALEGLIARGALSTYDRDIVTVTERLAPDWFLPHAY